MGGVVLIHDIWLGNQGIDPNVLNRLEVTDPQQLHFLRTDLPIETF